MLFAVYTRYAEGDEALTYYSDVVQATEYAAEIDEVLGSDSRILMLATFGNDLHVEILPVNHKLQPRRYNA